SRCLRVTNPTDHTPLFSPETPSHDLPVGKYQVPTPEEPDDINLKPLHLKLAQRNFELIRRPVIAGRLQEPLYIINSPQEIKCRSLHPIRGKPGLLRNWRRVRHAGCP